MSRVLKYLLIFVIISGKDLSVSCRKANVYWREYLENVPLDALATEHGTYVGQLTYSTGLLPGTLYPKNHLVISQAQDDIMQSESNIKILCTPEPETLKWEYVNVAQVKGELLDDCVIGGNENGSTLDIEKVFHEGEWKIGKVYPATSYYAGLRIWFNNGTIYTTEDFQILMLA